MASTEKAKGREGEEEKEKDKENSKNVTHRKRKWWKKCKELIIRLFMMRSGEWQKGEGKQKRCLGKFGKWLFLLLILVKNWLSVSAAAEGSQRRTEAVISMQQEVQIKERSPRERAPKRWKKPKGRDTKEMVEEAKVLRCTLVDVEDRESA